MPYIGNPIYQSAFVTDTFSGNGSTTAFTMSVAPAGTTNVLVAISGVLQDPATYGVVGNTITFSTAPPTGTGNISCRYLGVPATGVTTTAYRTVTEFTATAGQTTFTPPSYTVGFINVYRNGVLLGSADYTATNGTTVVLTTGATSGDLVTVESFYVSSILNAIPSTPGSVNTNLIADNAITTAKIAAGQILPASGIAFPATQSASSDANTLDDYEEGTWTPTFSFSGGNGTLTYGTQLGRYTKIGNVVTASCYIAIGSKGTASGDVRIVLPFASRNVSLSYQAATLWTNGFTGVSGGYQAYIVPNSTLVNLFYTGTGAQATLTASQCGNGTDFMITAVYAVDN